MTRIVLLHATPVARQPIHSTFHAIWPEAAVTRMKALIEERLGKTA